MAKADWNFYFGVLSFKDGASIENSILTFDSDSEVTIEDSIVVLPPMEGESDTNIFNLLKNAENVETSRQLYGYTGVRVYAGTDDDGNQIIFESGDTSGTVLEVTNELMGNQEMADNILADIMGLRYQPLVADRALLDPSAEMGDGVTVNGVYSGIYTRATTFGRLMASDVSAPVEEEIDHEFAVETPSDRKYTRFVQQTKAMLKITATAIDAEVSARTEADEDIRATLSIQATEIAAKVSQTGGSNTTNSFSWSLTASGHEWYANGSSTPVFKIDKTGAHVNGEITATSGKIGGFDIKSNYLSYNGQTWTEGKNNGIYLGTSGLYMGKDFWVDASGNMTARSLTLQGNITFKKSDGSVAGTLSASDLRQGAVDGYNWSNGSYGDYPSQASYALSGAGSGFTAQTNWSNAKNPAVGAGTLYGTFVGEIQARSLKIAGGSYGLFYNIGLWSGTIDGQQMQLVVWQ